MEPLVDLAKIIIPAGLVLYAMYLMVRSFLNKELEKRMLELKMKNTESILPIRLQAYERMCLFLERISPSNLLARLSTGNLTSKELQHVLLKEIRDEFNHNLSQQLYMSDDAWRSIKSAMESVIMIVNQAITEVNPESKSIELAKAVIQRAMQEERDPVEQALSFMKDEIRKVF
ncbi:MULTISPECIES: hypothetical protein [Imperialibacter]|jgi:hypothetical protein|uniref:Uncharacterized protein n=1 Tax=Imperialibacter roseus TaxID=1324217 RepID=A0ABZ0IJB7_9BACT|nr:MULTISPECIES: hypothetical protein [Imperialibacter]WOK05117.1 hypothetical protein RT717_18710 [Imperialibacter roseus]CAD5255282.1 conserved hypothetical protein [Imperialibacter sp. 75]CAD5263845.1 conserved hypothetical protein [Imperialibacter sp. 89]VVT35512.1 conserved hypothetical protein [Imperialibacter sp. EC-SDR9]|tara:strand:- start:440 stop:961 length:522 start_codon:yes stop_codon:yes gene_type:complete